MFIARALLLSGLALVAAGCALRTAPASNTTLDDAALQNIKLTNSERARLEAYVQAVEERARRQNVDVIWVNPPDENVFSDTTRLREILNRTTPGRR